MHDWTSVAYFGVWVVLVAVVLLFTYGVLRLAYNWWTVKEHYKWEPRTVADVLGGRRHDD